MRKKLLFTWLVLGALFCGKIAAQLPKQSTEENPIWYYVKVVGVSAGNTDNRVLTASGEDVLGLPVSFEMSDMEYQLWRFEVVTIGEERGYQIVNKATKKKLSAIYDSAKKVRKAVVSDDPTTVWRFPNASAPYNIKMSIEPTGGTSGSVYLLQTGSTQNYELRFGGSSYVSSNNALFTFELNNNPMISTDEHIVWMNIKNAKTGNYLTDESLGSDASFSMKALIDEDGITPQQWKLIKKDNGRIDFVNRATGNVIHTKTHFERYYYLLNTNNTTDSDGWNLEPLGKSQFAASTTNQDGIVNYWYATTPDEATSSFVAESAQNSSFAWTFSIAFEEKGSSIDDPILGDDGIRIYPCDRRICVEGCDDYRIYTVYGIPVLRNEYLPTGIYLVTVKGKTTKVLVK